MLLAPGRTFCGSIRFGAVRSSQAISPCCFPPSQFWNWLCAGGRVGGGEPAIVKSQFERPLSDGFFHARSL